MVDCSCYHDEKNFLGKRGVCWGTKEREACSCGGDASKCDFYDYVRERAKKPLTNYDILIRRSPEELAEFLEMIPHCGNPATYTTDGFCIDDGIRTKRQWLSWLKQEVNDERN